jgi:hypothetical protein
MGHIRAFSVCGVVLLAGCSGGILGGVKPTQGAQPSSSAGARLVGGVHGGQQPIAGSHVYLLAAGTNGYGQASVSLLTSGTGSDGLGTYVATDGNGGFSITGDYTCAAGQQVYVYALGGDPGAGTNAAAGLMAALGNCPVEGVFPSSLFISVNEVSTVAAAYAMAGFATDATHVSSSGTALALTGIANAFRNAANLADLSSGAALATTPAGNGTVPQAEINTLANVLAACVNSAGPASAGCSTLFGNAMDGATAPTDTATAAINIAHHPVANVANLFGLASGTPPFAPGLSTAPNDWTVAIAYTTVQLDSNGKGASLGQLAIDGQGNVWIVNLQTTSLNTAPSVSELSSNGTILSGAAGFTGGGLGGSTNTPGGIAIDLSGNVWASNGFYFDGGVGLPVFEGLALTEFSSSGTPMSGASGYATGCGGKGLAIDGLGNVWTSAGKCDSSGNYLFPVPTPAANFPNYPNEAWYISIDTSENAWYSGWTQITHQNASRLYQGGVWKLSNSGTMLYQTLPCEVDGALVNRDGFDMALSIANDNAGNAWVVAGPYDVRPTGIYELNSGGTTIFTPSITTATFPLDGPAAIDGAGNVWVGNDGFSLLNSIGLVEVSNSGTTLSGTTGFMTEQPPPGSIYGFVSVSGLGVDGSGNVWEALSRYPFVLQYVGVATPVVTPLAVGVKNGTLGMRP